MRLQTTIAKWMLKRKKANLSITKKIHNFNTAQTVAVLWSVDEMDAFEMVKKQLEEYNLIDVHALFYNPEMQAVDSSEDSFSKQQLNWLGFPKEGVAVHFLQRNYDMLIDLTVQKKFPIEVLTELARASFKVGYSDTKKENPYDLNIDIHQQPEARYLAEQIIFYLNQIK